MIVVPPLFETALQLPLSDTGPKKVVYPILLTVELRARPTFVQAASHKSIPQIHSYRALTFPGSLKRIK
jgi:hypothetical protein